MPVDTAELEYGRGDKGDTRQKETKPKTGEETERAKKNQKGYN